MRDFLGLLGFLSVGRALQEVGLMKIFKCTLQHLQGSRDGGGNRLTIPISHALENRPVALREHLTPASRHNPKIPLAFPTNSPWQRWRENMDLQAP